MTVCIAAICTMPVPWQEAPFKMVIGAADRMLTAEADAIQYEAPVSKIYGMGRQCFAMVAGDSGIQASFVARATVAITKRWDLTKPDLVVPIEDVANLWAELFRQYRRDRAERRILTPRGMTFETFAQRQKRMLPHIVESIDSRLERARLDCAVIIAGHDATYPFAHIYVISDPGVVASANQEGFAAIGIGAGHAESQFMFAKYSPDSPLGAALFLMYSAKKHAETAPGVGKETDIVYAGAWDKWGSLNDEQKKTLDEIYQQTRTEIDAANAAATKRSDDYVKGLLEKAKKAAGENGQAAPPDDAGRISDGTPTSEPTA